MQVIPLIANPNQSLQILLDNQSMTFRVYQKNSSLYIDISKDNNPLCYGQKCLFGRSVMSFSQNLFKGSLHFIDIEENTAPSFSRLGERYFLVYLSESEEMPSALKW